MPAPHLRWCTNRAALYIITGAYQVVQLQHEPKYINSLSTPTANYKMSLKTMKNLHD
jgi:hypothetical protein